MKYTMEQLTGTYYDYRNHRALAIFDDEGEIEDVITTNGEIFVPDNAIIIRSDEPEKVQGLVDLGVIEPEVFTTVPSGFINLNAYILTDKGLSIWETDPASTQA